MQRALILILFLFSVITFAFAAKAEKTHLQELTSAFPYGLLTDDFGILTKDDLRINSCMGLPEPVSEGNLAYPYWQCFEVKKSKLICEGKKYDPTEKTKMSMLVISSIRDGVLHEFISRRPLPLTSCRSYLKDWLTFTKHQSHVCISGSGGFKDTTDGKVSWNWLLGRYKTKKGCDSYFAEECNMAYFEKNDYDCPPKQ